MHCLGGCASPAFSIPAPGIIGFSRPGAAAGISKAWKDLAGSLRDRQTFPPIALSAHLGQCTDNLGQAPAPSGMNNEFVTYANGPLL